VIFWLRVSLLVVGAIAIFAHHHSCTWYCTKLEKKFKAVKWAAIGAFVVLFIFDEWVL
jgi:uncharacterized membrane protein YeaQ/YmgE (transglycosylase-associated protein family)